MANAEVNAFHHPGRRVLAKAIAGNIVSKVKEPASRTKLNEPGTNELTGSDSTLLTLALTKQTAATTEIVQVLLKAGVDPNQASEKGFTSTEFPAANARGSVTHQGAACQREMSSSPQMRRHSR